MKSTHEAHDTRREGFDNPSTIDLLDRQTLVQQVYQHLTNLDPEWSVRVGLIAPWGEGKTTICDWILARAQSEGHLAAIIRPWAAKTDAELWYTFYTEIKKALPETDQAFPFPTFPRPHINFRKLGTFFCCSYKWIVEKLKDWVRYFITRESVRKVSAAHDYSQATLNVIQTVFAITIKDIAQLCPRLEQGKRIIVVIDDLDRVESSLIPRFLLFLRDIMDIKSFSFLLPFDESIVSNALTQYGFSTEYGENFLDKILEYRIHIPAAKEEAVALLFKKELQAYCPFVDFRSFDSSIKLLPKNPRKLKGLVRSLRVFENEAKRHRNGEIDWRALLLGQMIKVESNKFFDLYIKDTFFTEIAVNDVARTSRPNPWTTAFMNNEGDGDKLEQNRVNELAIQCDITDKKKTERIIALCEELRKSYALLGHNAVIYAAKLLNAPEILTWGEFDCVWNIWTNYKDLSKTDLWIEAHAKKLAVSNGAMIKELLTSLSQRYAELLERAAAVALATEHAEIMKEADVVLEFTDSIINRGDNNANSTQILTPDIFQKFFNTALKWVHFKGNEADTRHRERERNLLKKWTHMAARSDHATEFAQMLCKLENDVSHFGSDSALLVRELTHIENDVLVLAAASALSEPEGIRKLFPYEAGIGVKDTLLNPTSALWNPAISSKGLMILSEASQNTHIQKNALDFLDLIRKCANEGSYGMGVSDVNSIFNHPDLLVKIWNAAVATPLQFRRLSETRDIRTYLIKKAIDEKLLAIPDWLMSNAKLSP